MNLYNVINDLDGTYKAIYKCAEVLKSVESVKVAREKGCHELLTKEATLDWLKKKERDGRIDEYVEQLIREISGKTKEDIFEDVEQKQKEIEEMEVQREKLESELKDLQEQESRYIKEWAKNSGEKRNKEAEKYNKIGDIQGLEGKKTKLKKEYEHTTNWIASFPKLRAKRDELTKNYEDAEKIYIQANKEYNDAKDAYDKSEQEYNNAVRANINAHEENNNNPCWDSDSPHFIQNCITKYNNKEIEKARKKQEKKLEKEEKARVLEKAKEVKEEEGQKKEEFDRHWGKYNDENIEIKKKELLEKKAQLEEEYKKLQEKINVSRSELEKIIIEEEKLKQEYGELEKNRWNVEKDQKELKSKKWKISEKKKEIEEDIRKLKEVEKLINKLAVLEKKKEAKLLVINYREYVEKAEAEENAEAERLAKEAAAEKAEAERIAKEAADKTEEMAEKLIAEAKDMRDNARHEREVVNSKLIQLLKDKKLEDLELHLKSAKDIRVSEKAMLEQFKTFTSEYNIKEGSEILSQFNTAKEEITTESKKQLSFVAEIQRYTDSIKQNNAMVEAENYENDGAFDEIDTKTTEYHDHGSEL